MSARTLNLFSLFVSLFVLCILFRGLFFVLFFAFLACSFGLLYVLDLCSCTRLPFAAQIQGQLELLKRQTTGLSLLFGEVRSLLCASRKKKTRKKKEIDVRVPGRTLGTRHLPPRVASGVLTTSSSFSADHFLTRATDFSEQEGLLVVYFKQRLLSYILL